MSKWKHCYDKTLKVHEWTKFEDEQAVKVVEAYTHKIYGMVALPILIKWGRHEGQCRRVVEFDIFLFKWCLSIGITKYDTDNVEMIR